jgi:ubiquinone/menaquinone biosynthesis C-methylase UbiE
LGLELPELRDLNNLRDIDRIESNDPSTDTNMKMEELKRSLEFSSKIILGYLILLGAVSNIISALNKGLRTPDEISREYGYKNKLLLNSYLNTLVKYDIIEREDDEYFLHSNPPLKIDINDLRIARPAEDLITFLTSILKFFPYAIIDSHHPAVTTSFDKDYDVWDIWLNNEWYKLTREVIADAGAIKKGEFILDAGCGASSPLFYGKLVGPKGKIQGIDKSEGLVNLARKRAIKYSYGWVDIKQADIEEKILFKERYDAAILADVLQYIDNIKLVLKNIHNGLKKGGRVIIFTKCFADSNSPSLPLLEFIHSLIPRYKRFWGRTEIVKVLQELGFKIDVNSIYEDMILIAYKEGIS